MNIALLVSWHLMKWNDNYYIANTHYVYLKYITKHYDNVWLISTISADSSSSKALNSLEDFTNLIVVELPAIKSYINALSFITKYYFAIKSVTKKVDIVYCRIPDPFSWMPRLLFNKPCIFHFVGDTIDATWHNEKWSSLRKRIMILGYYPEYLLTLWASSKSIVYTNGYHIAKKLETFGIKAVPLTSSTVSIDEMPVELPKLRLSKKLHIVYVGFIRYAKGMTCLMGVCKKLKDNNIDFVFDIVGDGEMMLDLRNFIEKENLHGYINLCGRIDDRKNLLTKIRESELFFFPSLSEGSPRVVIEAMSQGIPVVSTPVGSLPMSFTDKDSIRFFDFNDVDAAYNIICEYIYDKSAFEEQRNRAYELVKSKYTIEKFLGKIFK